MTSMQALQLVEWQAEPELREVPVPEPGPGEVLLRVEGAGLCHSDLHLMESPEGTVPYELPFTLGHENAGRVAALGAGVSGIEEGEPVLVYGPRGCGRCRRCAAGAINVCEGGFAARGHGVGMGYDGGLANFVLAPFAHLVPLGRLDPILAAPLTDAALTSYHAVKDALALLGPGSEVAVIGVGGLGHAAIQILRALTAARIVAVDVRPEALTLAQAAGAHASVDSGATEREEIRGEFSGGGATLALDFVGIDDTLELAAGLIREGGRVTIVGVGGGTLPVTAYENPPLGSSVTTPNWGSLPELFEVVELARDGLLQIEVERLSLAGAIDGYRRLRRGEIVGRAVATPNGAEATGSQR